MGASESRGGGADKDSPATGRRQSRLFSSSRGQGKRQQQQQQQQEQQELEQQQRERERQREQEKRDKEERLQREKDELQQLKLDEQHEKQRQQQRQLLQQHQLAAAAAEKAQSRSQNKALQSSTATTATEKPVPSKSSAGPSTGGPPPRPPKMIQRSQSQGMERSSSSSPSVLSRAQSESSDSNGSSVPPKAKSTKKRKAPEPPIKRLDSYSVSEKPESQAKLVVIKPAIKKKSENSKTSEVKSVEQSSKDLSKTKLHRGLAMDSEAIMVAPSTDKKGKQSQEQSLKCGDSKPCGELEKHVHPEPKPEVKKNCSGNSGNCDTGAVALSGKEVDKIRKAGKDIKTIKSVPGSNRRGVKDMSSSSEAEADLGMRPEPEGMTDEEGCIIIPKQPPTRPPDPPQKKKIKADIALFPKDDTKDDNKQRKDKSVVSDISKGSVSRVPPSRDATGVLPVTTAHLKTSKDLPPQQASSSKPANGSDIHKTQTSTQRTQSNSAAGIPEECKLLSDCSSEGPTTECSAKNSTPSTKLGVGPHNELSATACALGVVVTSEGSKQDDRDDKGKATPTTTIPAPPPLSGVSVVKAEVHSAPGESRRLDEDEEEEEERYDKLLPLIIHEESSDPELSAANGHDSQDYESDECADRDALIQKTIKEYLLPIETVETDSAESGQHSDFELTDGYDEKYAFGINRYSSEVDDLIARAVAAAFRKDKKSTGSDYSTSDSESAVFKLPVVSSVNRESGGVGVVVGQGIRHAGNTTTAAEHDNHKELGEKQGKTSAADCTKTGPLSPQQLEQTEKRALTATDSSSRVTSSLDSSPEQQLPAAAAGKGTPVFNTRFEKTKFEAAAPERGGFTQGASADTTNGSITPSDEVFLDAEESLHADQPLTKGKNGKGHHPVVTSYTVATSRILTSPAAAPTTLLRRHTTSGLEPDSEPSPEPRKKGEEKGYYSEDSDTECNMATQAADYVGRGFSRSLDSMETLPPRRMMVTDLDQAALQLDMMKVNSTTGSPVKEAPPYHHHQRQHYNTDIRNLEPEESDIDAEPILTKINNWIGESRNAESRSPGKFQVQPSSTERKRQMSEELSHHDYYDISNNLQSRHYSLDEVRGEGSEFKTMKPPSRSVSIDKSTVIWPKMVPEKLDFQQLEKFEGKPLTLCSIFSTHKVDYLR